MSTPRLPAGSLELPRPAARPDQGAAGTGEGTRAAARLAVLLVLGGVGGAGLALQKDIGPSARHGEGGAAGERLRAHE